VIALAAPHDFTLLVVDDEDAVRQIIARELKQEGYQVLTAADGQEALDVMEQSGIGVHLVVCDLVMPRLDGYQLASRLAELPNAPEIIFITAFRSDLELDGLPILTKPFHLDDLRTAVQLALQKRASHVPEASPQPLR
jgi:two-component system, cell cycle sensor histidine kinase and response regulator CckA